MCRIPVAAVLFAGVQVIGVNREPATGAMLPGVWRKARRFQAKLLTEPRLVFDPPKPGLLPGQVHGPSEHAGIGRVREHLSLGGVASAASASTRISVGVCSDSCSCSCSSIDTRIVVRHLVRHDALQDPRAVLGPDGGMVCFSSWVVRIARLWWRGSPLAKTVLRDKLLMHLFERDEARIGPGCGILEVLSVRQPVVLVLQFSKPRNEARSSWLAEQNPALLDSCRGVMPWPPL